MAQVGTATERFQVRSSGSTWDGQQFNRTYTRSFNVVFDSKHDGPKAARNASGIPSLGDRYVNSDASETDIGAVCTSKNVKQTSDKDQLHWIVTCQYSVLRSGTDPQSGAKENPIERRAEWNWQSEEFTRIADVDNEGDPIDNSAGWQFDPPPEIDDARVILNVVINQGAFDHLEAKEYSNVVNDDTFGGHEAGDVMCKPITAEHVWEGEYEYFRVTYRFHFREGRQPDGKPRVGGWDKELLDYGPYSLGEESGDPPTREKIVSGDENGVPVLKNLDGEGGLLADGEDAVFLPFEVYPRKSFGALNIPSYVFGE